MIRLVVGTISFIGMLVGGMTAGWYMNGKTDFFWSWTAGGAIAGLVVGLLLGSGVKAAYSRFFDQQWPTLF